MQTIRLGSRGSDVAVWQKIVGAGADGVFGAMTAALTRGWQTTRGLKPDGVVGPATWAAALSPAGAPEMLRGLDASAVQGALPYAELLSEIDASFVVSKAQQGNDGFDPLFERNVKAALDHGLEPFAYCFLYPLPHLRPEDQARRFVEEIFRRAPSLRGRPVFLDIEWPEVVPSKPGPGAKGWKEWGCSPAEIASWSRACAAEVEELTGRRPVLYVYDWWWSCVRDGAPAYGFPAGGDVSWAADHDLWMAWYRSGWPIPGDAPKIPAPFRGWRFWQFDGNGGLRLPNGVDSDFCVFNGGRDALREFVSGA